MAKLKVLYKMFALLIYDNITRRLQLGRVVIFSLSFLLIGINNITFCSLAGSKDKKAPEKECETIALRLVRQLNRLEIILKEISNEAFNPLEKTNYTQNKDIQLSQETLNRTEEWMLSNSFCQLHELLDRLWEAVRVLNTAKGSMDFVCGYTFTPQVSAELERRVELLEMATPIKCLEEAPNLLRYIASIALYATK